MSGTSILPIIRESPSNLIDYFTRPCLDKSLAIPLQFFAVVFAFEQRFGQYSVPAGGEYHSIAVATTVYFGSSPLEVMKESCRLRNLPNTYKPINWASANALVVQYRLCLRYPPSLVIVPTFPFALERHENGFFR